MSDLASCHSYKSAILILLASEVGFIGVNPMHPHKMYEGFALLMNHIRAKVMKKDFTDEYCNFYHTKESGEVISPDFVVDYNVDLAYFTDIAKLTQTTIAMSGGLDDMTLDMVVSGIYRHAGRILNSDDSYFEVLLQLWSTINAESPHYEVIKQHKLTQLRDVFALSDERLKQLNT